MYGKDDILFSIPIDIYKEETQDNGSVRLVENGTVTIDADFNKFGFVYNSQRTILENYMYNQKSINIEKRNFFAKVFDVDLRLQSLVESFNASSRNIFLSNEEKQIAIDNALADFRESLFEVPISMGFSDHTTNKPREWILMSLSRERYNVTLDSSDVYSQMTNLQTDDYINGSTKDTDGVKQYGKEWWNAGQNKTRTIDSVLLERFNYRAGKSYTDPKYIYHIYDFMSIQFELTSTIDIGGDEYRLNQIFTFLIARMAGSGISESVAKDYGRMFSASLIDADQPFNTPIIYDDFSYNDYMALKVDQGKILTIWIDSDAIEEIIEDANTYEIWFDNDITSIYAVIMSLFLPELKVIDKNGIEHDEYAHKTFAARVQAEFTNGAINGYNKAITLMGAHDYSRYLKNKKDSITAAHEAKIAEYTKKLQDIKDTRDAAYKKCDDAFDTAVNGPAGYFAAIGAGIVWTACKLAVFWDKDLADFYTRYIAMPLEDLTYLFNTPLVIVLAIELKIANAISIVKINQYVLEKVFLKNILSVVDMIETLLSINRVEGTRTENMDYISNEVLAAPETLQESIAAQMRSRWALDWKNKRAFDLSRPEIMLEVNGMDFTNNPEYARILTRDEKLYPKES